MEDSPKDVGHIRAVALGGSAGAIPGIQSILHALPNDFDAAVIIVLHLHHHSDTAQTVQIFSRYSVLPVQEAEDKGLIRTGTIYVAPANYHLLIEKDQTFSLSIDEKVNFSRPSIDVLFESAAEAYRQELIGVLLSGASADGSHGIQRIKQLGGQVAVQTPESAEFPLMPRSAIETCTIDVLLSPGEIGGWLVAAQNSAAIEQQNSDGTEQF